MLQNFELGQTVATPGAVAAMEKSGVSHNVLLSRHVAKDWFELPPEDRATNEHALLTGQRIFSSFKYPEVKFWVITEWDRSVTTILLPDEY